MCNTPHIDIRTHPPKGIEFSKIIYFCGAARDIKRNRTFGIYKLIPHLQFSTDLLEHTPYLFFLVPGPINLI